MDTEQHRRTLSVVIPTYGRDRILVETIEYLLALEHPADEIVIVDQSPAHDAQTETRLTGLEQAGAIRWIRGLPPSIPAAMNRGLLDSTGDFVMFLDDDLIPEPGLVRAHLEAHAREPGIIVAGRVIQPWEEGKNFSGDSHFHFACMQSHWISEFMGGNFSIGREQAIELGGFDENFVRVAYRFEAEFAYRFRRAGGRILFEPAACIHHLKVGGGGTRTFGEHLTTVRPDHAVGAYYFWLRTWEGAETLRAFLGRPLRAIVTRHHLRRPWWIPVTLVAELRGMFWALGLFLKGPRYVTSVVLPQQGQR